MRLNFKSLSSIPLICQIGFCLVLLTLSFLSEKSLAGGVATDIELREALKSLPEAPEKTAPSLLGSYLAANVATLDNQEKEAIESFRRASELAPENEELREELFVALVGDGQYEELTKMISILSLEAKDGKENVLEPAVDSIKIIENFKHKSWQQVLNAADRISIRKIEALKQNNWRRMLERVDESASSDRDRLVAEVLASWALFAINKVDEAVARINKYSGTEWTRLIADYHQALILAAAGRQAEAEKSFDKVIAARAFSREMRSLFQRNIDAKVRTIIASGKEAALKVFEDLPEIIALQHPIKQLKLDVEADKIPAPLISTASQGGAELAYNIGAVFANQRQNLDDYAQVHLQIAHYLDPQSDAINFALGEIFNKQDKYERANGFFARIEENSPLWSDAQLQIGINLDELKKFEEAKPIFQKLMESEPDNWVAASSYGTILVRHEQFKEAVSVYDKVIANLSTKQKTTDWVLYYRSAIAHDGNKDWPQAERDLKKALEISPEEPWVLNYLGYTWIDRGEHLDKGLEMIKTAVKLNERDYNDGRANLSGAIIDSLGWAYFRLERYDEAIVELERALAILPGDPEINDHVGDAYWKAGRKREALFMWKHALSYKPKEDAAAKIREKLEKGLN